MPEILTDRQPPASGVRAVPAETHWVEFDAVSLGRGQKRALCGAIVDRSSFSTDPTCHACHEEMARIERMEF